MDESRPTRVYIANASGHDMTDAARFGELHFITKGEIDRFRPNYMLRRAVRVLHDSEPDDYLLLTSLTILCSVICAVFARKHGTLNLLLFRNGKYIARKMTLDNLITMPEEL